MPTVTPTKLSTILLNIQQQLMTSLALPAERVLITDPDDVPFHPQADTYVCLWPQTENPVMPNCEGGGRLDARVVDRCYVACRTRTILDESTSSLIWLTDQTLGHVVFRHSVWDALFDYHPADGSNNLLTLEPLLPAPASSPKRQRQEREWGESRLQFDVAYTLLLTLTVPL